MGSGRWAAAPPRSENRSRLCQPGSGRDPCGSYGSHVILARVRRLGAARAIEERGFSTRGAPPQTPPRKPQSRKRWGLGHAWHGLGVARAPSPDARRGHRALDSLHVRGASPSWLRLLPQPGARGAGSPEPPYPSIARRHHGRRSTRQRVLRYSSTAVFSSSVSASGKSWPAALLPGLRVSKNWRRSAGTRRPGGMAARSSTSSPTRASS